MRHVSSLFGNSKPRLETTSIRRSPGHVQARPQLTPVLVVLADLNLVTMANEVILIELGSHVVGICTSSSTGSIDAKFFAWLTEFYWIEPHFKGAGHCYLTLGSQTMKRLNVFAIAVLLSALTSNPVQSAERQRVFRPIQEQGPISQVLNVAEGQFSHQPVQGNGPAARALELNRRKNMFIMRSVFGR